MDTRKLLAIWEAATERLTWTQAIEKATPGSAEHATAHDALAELPEVTPLEGLRANAQLVKLLTRRRWHVMLAAREAGASWEEIGEALGMSRQAAWEWYHHK